MKRVLVRMPWEKTFGLNMLQGIAEFMSQHESWQLVVPGERGWPREIDVRAWEGDGMILPVIRDETIQWLHSCARPFVNVTARPDLPTVRSDNEAMGRLAAEYFLQQGYRYYGFLGVKGTYYSAQREIGFRNTLESQGLQVRVLQSSYGGGETLRGWLAAFPLPAVIQCATDMLALSVYELCQDLDLHIPDQIAVAGMDDEIVGLTLSPPLSSVQSDGRRVGYEAAKMLHGQFQGIAPPTEPVLIPPLGMAARPSTAAFGYDDPAVVKALVHIRQHAQKGLLVDRVAAEVGLSRRNLERRFVQVVGHTLWQEMRRVQIEHVKNLLRTSNRPIKQIARQTAFPNPARLAQVFQAESGETPGAYRQRHR